MVQTMAELRRVSKRYANVVVLHDVDFQINTGEIHALLGGNGAGKSTLVKILAGLATASAGDVLIGGRLINHANPARAQAMGLYLVPQEAHIFPNKSVLENICMGLPLAARAYRKSVIQYIAELGVDLSPDTPAATLEVADRQLLEILRGMIRRARVLILDEPTSALTPLEVAALFGRLRALRNSGTALVFITHKLHEVRAICDRISVLRDGSIVLSETLDQCSDQQIVAAINPTAKISTNRRSNASSSAEILRVDNLSGEGFEHVSLQINRGEILGLTGVVGAGRTELGETLFGLRPVASGQVLVQGEQHTHLTPRRAVDAGLVYLSEDRQQFGLFLSAPLFFNTSSFVSHLLPFVLRPKKERERFNTYRDAMDIRCENPDQLVSSLSGGNQQKVLLSKCLAAQPTVLLLDEPTRGVDVGARNDIYEIIEQLAGNGTAVLLISSDFDEIVRLSDRITVMTDGVLAGELPANASTEEIASLAFESKQVMHA
jgi:AI-2 transport system ATP-binding protein